jgi:hypothetical protein
VSPAAPVAAEGATTPDGFLTLAATPPVEIDSGFVDVAGLPTVFFYEQTAPHDSVTLTRGSVRSELRRRPHGGAEVAHPTIGTVDSATMADVCASLAHAMGC